MCRLPATIPAERRLAPARPPGAEDVEAEELGDGDRCRERSPEHERAEHDREVLCTAYEEGHAEREHSVLAELEEAHEMGVEVGVVERHGPEDLEREPDEERGPGDPEHPGRSQSPEPGAGRHDERGDEDREHREVGEAHVDRGRAGVDRQVRLEPLVQEEEGERGCEDERPGGLPVEREASAKGPRPEALGRRRHGGHYRCDSGAGSRACGELQGSLRSRRGGASGA